MTADVLRTHTRKELETMARRDRIAGWHDMNKEELVHAILKNFHSRRPVRDTDRPSSRPTHSRQPSRNGHSTAPAAPSSASRRTRGESAAPGNLEAVRKPEASRRRNRSGDEAPPEIIPERQAAIRDEVTVEGFDARWIHVNWTVSQATRERAKASLGAQWRSAVAVLRIFDVSGDEDRGTSRLRSGDVNIDLDEGHWFVRNSQPGRRSVVEIGYRLPSGQFHTLLHSSPVTLAPERGSARGERHAMNGASYSGNGVGTHGAEKAGRRTADQLIPKSVSAARHALDSRASEGAVEAPPSEWRLQVQAELVLTGQTHPRAEVKALHQKVNLNSDGRFSLRVPLENGRLVLPAEVVSPDGSEQRMTIVAVEYNVRELEAQVFDETAD
jgi:hypothetical protein